MSRITGVLGPFPPKVLAAGRDTFKYFTLANVLYEKVGDPPVLDKHICTFKYFFTLANVLYEKVGDPPVLDKHICTFKYSILANVLYEKVGS